LLRAVSFPLVLYHVLNRALLWMRYRVVQRKWTRVTRHALTYVALPGISYFSNVIHNNNKKQKIINVIKRHFTNICPCLYILWRVGRPDRIEWMASGTRGGTRKRRWRTGLASQRTCPRQSWTFCQWKTTC
jgi:hypothetical protein